MDRQFHRNHGCFHCGSFGHIRVHCPRIQCFRCNAFGHMSYSCTKQLSKPPGYQNVNIASQGNVARPPVSESLLGEGWNHCVSLPRSYSSSSSSSRASVGTGGTAKAHDVYLCSDVKSMEAVNRVADTLYTFIHPTDGPLHIFKNKHLEDFQKSQGGGLFIPETETDLQRGDLDIIIPHPIHGYIHIEVKAFGDYKATDEANSLKALRKTLEAAVKRLDKGHRALRHLQVKGDEISITSALAFPNLKRSFLRRALPEDHKFCKAEPCLRQELAARLRPNAPKEKLHSIDVSRMCLCSDDLPAKDQTADPKDWKIKKAIEAWWHSRITPTQKRKRKKAPCKETMEIILQRFMKSEHGRTLAEYAWYTGEQFSAMLTHEKQEAILNKKDQYLFITGTPGCGKSLVLAKKALQWLGDEKNVFVIYKDGNCTTQPATACIHNYIKALSATGEEAEKEENTFLRLHIMGLTTDINIDRVIKSILNVAEKPETGLSEFKRLCKKASDEVFEAMYEECQKPNTPSSSHQKGDKINIIIDEFTRRTIYGKRAELIAAVMERLPHAKIWCAGPLQSDRPDHDEFQVENLLFSYRCPPKIQRLLSELESFCHDGTLGHYEYCTRSTTTPMATFTLTKSKRKGSMEIQHMLPAEGTDPIFISHSQHRGEGHAEIGDILNCRNCAQSLVHYLKNTLQIHPMHTNPSPDVSGQNERVPAGCLTQKDVLIVLTGINTLNNMSHVAFSEFYRQLSDEGYDINVYRNSMRDRYDPESPNMTMMHVRAVGGVEKKVVVFVPCRQHQTQQADPDSPLAYADATRQSLDDSSKKTGSPEQNAELGTQNQYEISSKKAASPGKNADVGTQKQFVQTSCGVRCCPKSLFSESYDDHFPPLEARNMQGPAGAGESQKQGLASLGALNLHWLWYSASRSFSTVVIFHY